MTRHIPWPRVLAEGAAIVISILLAFGIQAWWENRQERSLEAGYLRRLMVDVQSDTSTFARVSRLALSKEQALTEAAPFLVDPSRPLSEIAPVALNDSVLLTDTAAFLQHLVNGSALGWQEPRARRTTFEELRSTGNLRLIADPVVRDQINTYYQGLEDTYRRVDGRRGSYPATTYRLIPRGASTTSDLSPAGQTTEFVVSEQLMGASRAEIMSAVRQSDLFHEAVAERNFASFSLQQHRQLTASAIALLRALETAIQRGP